MDKEFLDVVLKYTKQTVDYAKSCFEFDHMNEQERDTIVNTIEKLESELQKIQPAPGTDEDEH